MADAKDSTKTQASTYGSDDYLTGIKSLSTAPSRQLFSRSVIKAYFDTLYSLVNSALTGTTTADKINWNLNPITASGNAATVPITYRDNMVTNNSAATLTITITTTSAANWQPIFIGILDASAVAQTITWVNTENSSLTAPTTSNGSTTLPLWTSWRYNPSTSKWRYMGGA